MPIVLSELLSSREIVDRNGGLALICKCFDDLGKLVSLSYLSKVKFDSGLYVDMIAATYDGLRRSIKVHDAHLKARFPRKKKGIINIYNSSKMHIMYHLQQDMVRFGSPIFYETGKSEQFNKFIRESLFRTNRQNTSRDVAIAFSKRLIARHLLAGGSWLAAGQSIPSRCSNKVLDTVLSFAPTVRNFDNHDDANLSVKVGSTGIFRNKYNNLRNLHVFKPKSIFNNRKSASDFINL